MSAATLDFSPPGAAAIQQAMLADRRTDVWPRSRAEIADLFDGLELVPPGIVAVSDWRAEPESGFRPNPADVAMYGAVGRLG